MQPTTELEDYMVNSAGMDVSGEFSNLSNVGQTAECEPVHYYEFMFAGINNLFRVGALPIMCNGRYVCKAVVNDNTTVALTGDGKHLNAACCGDNFCYLCDGARHSFPHLLRCGQPWTMLDMSLEYDHHRNHFCGLLIVVGFDQESHDLVKSAKKISDRQLDKLLILVPQLLSEVTSPGYLVREGDQRAVVCRNLLRAVAEVDEIKQVYGILQQELCRAFLMKPDDSDVPVSNAVRCQNSVGWISKAMMDRLKVAIKRNHKHVMGRPIFCRAGMARLKHIPLPKLVACLMHSIGTACKSGLQIVIDMAMVTDENKSLAFVRSEVAKRQSAQAGGDNSSTCNDAFWNFATAWMNIEKARIVVANHSNIFHGLCDHRGHLLLEILARLVAIVYLPDDYVVDDNLVFLLEVYGTLFWLLLHYCDTVRGSAKTAAQANNHVHMLCEHAARHLDEFRRPLLHLLEEGGEHSLTLLKKIGKNQTDRKIDSKAFLETVERVSFYNDKLLLSGIGRARERRDTDARLFPTNLAGVIIYGCCHSGYPILARNFSDLLHHLYSLDWMDGHDDFLVVYENVAAQHQRFQDSRMALRPVQPPHLPGYRDSERHRASAIPFFPTNGQYKEVVSKVRLQIQRRGHISSMNGDDDNQDSDDDSDGFDCDDDDITPRRCTKERRRPPLPKEYFACPCSLCGKGRKGKPGACCRTDSWLLPEIVYIFANLATVYYCTKYLICTGANKECGLVPDASCICRKQPIYVIKSNHEDNKEDSDGNIYHMPIMMRWCAGNDDQADEDDDFQRCRSRYLTNRMQVYPLVPIWPSPIHCLWMNDSFLCNVSAALCLPVQVL